MKHFDNYERIIATKERSAGNETVGDMWTETRSFSRHIEIGFIIDWAKDCTGKLTITTDESDVSYHFFLAFSIRVFINPIPSHLDKL